MRLGTNSGRDRSGRPMSRDRAAETSGGPMGSNVSAVSVSPCLRWVYIVERKKRRQQYMTADRNRIPLRTLKL